MSSISTSIRVGIGGWTYEPWRGGAFYPKGWPQGRELEYASRQLSAIEINGTYSARRSRPPLPNGGTTRRTISSSR